MVVMSQKTQAQLQLMLVEDQMHILSARSGEGPRKTGGQAYKIVKHNVYIAARLQ